MPKQTVTLQCPNCEEEHDYVVWMDRDGAAADGRPIDTSG